MVVSDPPILGGCYRPPYRWLRQNPFQVVPVQVVAADPFQVVAADRVCQKTMLNYLVDIAPLAGKLANHLGL